MPLATAEDAREAWRLLQPVLEEVQADARRLARLQGAPLAAAGDAPLEPQLSLDCGLRRVMSPVFTRVGACPWLSGVASCMVRHTHSEYAQEQIGALLQRRGARLRATGAGLKTVGCGQFRPVVGVCEDAAGRVRAPQAQSPQLLGHRHFDRGAGRRAGVLEALRQHFPEPPAAVMGAWQPEALLDAADLDEAALLDGPRPAAALALLQPPGALLAAVRMPRVKQNRATAGHSTGGASMGAAQGMRFGPCAIMAGAPHCRRRAGHTEA